MALSLNYRNPKETIIDRIRTNSIAVVFCLLSVVASVSGACGDLLNAPKIEVSWGKNVDKKIRKHIDQVRNRGDVVDDIPSPGKSGIERVQEIIRQRVAQGGGRPTTYAGEAATAFEGGGVTYILRENGEFWTILKN